MTWAFISADAKGQIPVRIDPVKQAANRGRYDDGKTAPASPGRTPFEVSPMLRPAVLADTPALLDLAIATELFGPDEVGFLEETLAEFHAGHSGADHRLQVWYDDPGGPPVGVVYFGPNAVGDRTWDLLWISVAPSRQGQGIGGELIRFAEACVGAAGGRLLLIDTSSLPRFAATHAFYGNHGYAEVARIPDFYADGESKVIFAKRMADRGRSDGTG